MKHISVTKKLWLSIVCIVLGAVVIVGHAGYNSASHQKAFNVQDRLLSERLDQAMQWNALAQANIVRTQAALASGSAADAQAFEAQIADTQPTVQALVQALTASASEQEHPALQQLVQQRQQLQDLGARALQHKAQGQYSAAELAALRSSYDQAAQAYIQALNQFVSLQAQQLAQMRANMGEARQAVVRSAAINMVFLLLAIAVGAWLLIGSIRRSLHEANQIAEQIASGDLSLEHQNTRRDEFGQLLQSLQRMSQSLSRMIEDVRHSGEAIHLASNEIASGNLHLSERTETTASHLQQAAAAIDQLTQTLQQTALSAQQAADMAQHACGVAQNGGSVVQEVVVTMTDIHQHSQKIADIIGVIDGIAFQTNILALNAAVEAARAGEQGRGFAVVASEVRSLAQRSAQAAREIKELIQTSVGRISDGARLVKDAGSTMTEVVQSIQRVTQVMEAIRQDAATQRDGVAMVNQTVGSLDQMTLQNASLVEQSTAAAHSLREQSEHLRALVQRFKVQGVQGQDGQPARVAAPASIAGSALPPRTAAFAPALDASQSLLPQTP